MSGPRGPDTETSRSGMIPNRAGRFGAVAHVKENAAAVVFRGEESSMTSSPHTRPSLLVRIRDAADHQAWRQLVGLYAPLVYRFLRRRGLQDADAADLTQDVLRAVSAAAPGFEYDAGRGSFRGWLFT